jgi:hypothetical protein
MAFVEPVTLNARGVELVPLSLAHEDGLRARPQMAPCGISA